MFESIRIGNNKPNRNCNQTSSNSNNNSSIYRFSVGWRQMWVQVPCRL